MKTLTFLAIAFLLFFNCGGDVEFQTAEMPPPLADVLTLELSFGDEKTVTKNEFLLARPIGLAVNNNNDILVADEDWVKVFDRNGEEKMKLGGPGDGPGEFRRLGYIYTGPTGIIAATSLSRITLYSPDYVYIDEVNLKLNADFIRFSNELPYSSLSPRQIIQLSENSRIIYARSNTTQSDPPYTGDIDLLIFQDSDSFLCVTEYEPKILIVIDGYGSSIPFQSSFLWGMISENRAVYHRPKMDKETIDGQSYYILNEFSIDDEQTNKIIQPYKPVTIPDSLKQLYTNRNFRSDVGKFIGNIVKDITYYPPVQSIYTDRNYIFVFTYLTNNKNEILADVIDAVSQQPVSSAYFPFVPKLIKDGFFYNVQKNDDGFLVIAKYRIDSAVYGK